MTEEYFRLKIEITELQIKYRCLHKDYTDVLWDKERQERIIDELIREKKRLREKLEKLKN